MTGTFITIEGPDGAGKTTAAADLRNRLTAMGVPCLLTREPGGSAIAEQIRSILLNPENTAMDPVTEAILYAAARRQHLMEVVRPALEAGMTVICDRFVDSSLAYQGHARGLGFDTVWSINEPAVQDLLPDLTILLDIEDEQALARIQARGQLDRFDLEGRDFRKQVREGFLAALRRFPGRIVRIDGSQTREQVTEAILRVCRDRHIL
ncbi:dTMP kinase [uncultured Faecalibaculum sp.]|uniref:dTMP kinase n=1 Tax=uncultured Faecalibaculum sp. TaxID=1729681 RepID=UPI0025E2BF51|nr:dTMP kinase [uncultured Faecalibaculum sp.]